MSKRSVKQKREKVPVEAPSPAASRSYLAGEKLPDAEWNLTRIPNDETWAALIWEYGRSATWVHPMLPQHDLPDERRRDSQIARFHAQEPAPAVIHLNQMRLWQLILTTRNDLKSVDFFGQSVPWLNLPTIVRSNMRRAVFGLEPEVNLLRFKKLLEDDSPDDGSGSLEVASILDQHRAFESVPLSPEEKALLDEPQSWLPGGNGLDDVTAGVVKGEEHLRILRQTLDENLKNNIAPATCQQRLQKAWSGEISLRRFQIDPSLKQEGYFAAAFRGNWRLKDAELIEQFSKWLGQMRPDQFKALRKGKRSTSRGPDGIVLKRSGGYPAEPATALKQLGTWRILQASGSPSEAIARYWPTLSGKAYAAKEVELSRDFKEAAGFLQQLFPHSQR